MKTFLPLFLLFVSVLVNAQNFRTANTFKTNYYGDSLDWRFTNVPFKADSFNLETNGDTLITFLEVLNDPYTTFAFCGDTASVGWQGENVLLQTDGTDIYYNKNNEAIVINTQANINDTWIFYDENIRFEATLLQIENQTVLGVMDSIKTFSIQAIDIDNNPIANALNNTTYQFSKNYGWISAPSFNDFPTAIKHEIKGIQNERLGIYNITENDIYNFNVGDEFHIREGNIFSQNHYQVFILTKQLGANNKWEYTYNVVRHVFWEYDINTGVVTGTEIIPGVVPRQVIPETAVNLSPLPITFYIDSTDISAFSLINKSLILNKNQKIMDDVAWTNNNGCWWYATVLGFSHINTYIDNLGGPYGGSSSSGTGIIASLQYYKSGNVTYGNPIDFDFLLQTETVINESEALKIYPNPATDFINIELESNQNFPADIVITNHLGQVVEQGQLTQNTQQVPIHHLTKGLYVIQIKIESTIYVHRFIKQ